MLKYLNSLPDYKLIEIWNVYCEPEDRIMHMEDGVLNTLGYPPVALAKAVYYGDVDFNDRYFRIKNGNIFSLDNSYDNNSPIDIQVLADILEAYNYQPGDVC